MSKGLLLRIAICAALFVGAASATYAGEVTGTGESLKPLKGNSRCAFSGLEDNPFAPGNVQSFGRHPADGTGVSDDPANNNPSNTPGPAAPGFACNPSDPQNEPS